VPFARPARAGAGNLDGGYRLAQGPGGSLLSRVVRKRPPGPGLLARPNPAGGRVAGQPKSGSERAPRAVGRLPATFSGCGAYRPAGDRCQCCKWLRPHGDGRLGVRPPPGSRSGTHLTVGCGPNPVTAFCEPQAILTVPLVRPTVRSRRLCVWRPPASFTPARRVQWRRGRRAGRRGPRARRGRWRGRWCAARGWRTSRVSRGIARHGCAGPSE